MRPQVGEIINGKYRLVRLIGEGGMGSVYEARHEYLGSAVALKFLDPDLARRPGLVARFLQEARVSASIRNPHVVQVSDVDQSSEGLPYLVMELLEGESLQRTLSRTGRLPIPAALDIAAQILDGLDAAHNAHVVHRDLKPDNVFLVPTRQGALAKLLDFGIAKLRISEEFQKGLTRPGVLMGTPEYMAPEQAFSADTADLRADLYSLGVIIFEMVTGRRPVSGDDPRIMAAGVLAGRVPSLLDVDPSLPPALSAIVQRAMAGRPADRFSCANEMLAAIAPFLPAQPSSMIASYGSPPLGPTPTPLIAAAPGLPPAGSPAPTAPDDEPAPGGVAPTLPPEEPSPQAGPPTGIRPTGTVLGSGPNEMSAPADYGATAQMSPYGYGPAPHAAPPQPPAMAMYPPTAPPATRIGARRGLSLGIIAAIAGALAVSAGVAIWIGVTRSETEPTGPTTTFPVVTTTEPTSTTPPTTTPPPIVATTPPTTTTTVRPPATGTAPVARKDGGAGGSGDSPDAGIVIPFPLPSALPSTLPPIPGLPSSFPFPIPGLPQ